MHAQVTLWYGSANHSGNDENKHDRVTFQLAAVDLNSSILFFSFFFLFFFFLIFFICQYNLFLYYMGTRSALGL